MHNKFNIKQINLKLSQIKGEERENSYQKLKRSPWERHTQTHGNLIKIFRWPQLSFSIRRE